MNFWLVNMCWPLSQQVLTKSYIRDLLYQNITTPDRIKFWSHAMEKRDFAKESLMWDLVNTCWLSGQHMLTNQKFMT